MSLFEIKNYLFAYAFNFVLYGVCVTTFATIIFGILYYFGIRVRFKIEDRYSTNLSSNVPKIQQVKAE